MAHKQAYTHAHTIILELFHFVDAANNYLFVFLSKKNPSFPEQQVYRVD